MNFSLLNLTLTWPKFSFRLTQMAHIDFLTSLMTLISTLIIGFCLCFKLFHLDPLQNIYKGDLQELVQRKYIGRTDEPFFISKFMVRTSNARRILVEVIEPNLGWIRSTEFILLLLIWYKRFCFILMFIGNFQSDAESQNLLFAANDLYISHCNSLSCYTWTHCWHQFYERFVSLEDSLAWEFQPLRSQ